MAFKIGKIKIERTTLVQQGETIDDPIVIVETLDTGLYDDITSIENWEKYGSTITNDMNLVRSEIKALVDSKGWGSMSNNEKKIATKFFVVDKSKRDDIATDDEQKDLADELVKKNLENKSVVGGLLYDMTYDEITNYLSNNTAHLINFVELDEEIEGLYDGVWHEIATPAMPNTVIMVNIRNNNKNKSGGVRCVGSNLDRRREVKSKTSFAVAVKTSSESKIEIYRQDVDVTFHITAQLS
jgi:UDP-N-acetylglucosamine transferase subunit ALG13